MTHPQAVTPELLAVTDVDYVEQRLREGGLRLVSGSPTMLQDEFASYEAAIRENDHAE